MSILRKYIDAAVSSATSRAIVAGSGILVMFLLNAIVGKADFGTFMLALTIMRISGLIVSSGFSQLLLFRVSREASSVSDSETARRMLGNSLFYALVLSILLAVVMLILRNDIGRLASKPELAHWLLASGLIIPADVVRYVVASWYQAWQRIRIAVFVRDGFTAMLLPLLLFGVWLTGGEYFTPESAALIYATSSVLPSLVLLILHPPQLSLVQGVFSRWDISYGGKMSLTKLAAQPARQIDIVFVGFLASSGMTAEYVLASRLAQVLMMSKSFLAQLLVPRIGYRLARFETDQLVTEYNAVRGTSLFIAISAGLIIVAFPSQIMGLFGDYTQSAVLVTLVAAMLIRVGAGPSGNYLAQAGYAGWTLVNIIFGLVANAALAIWWVPKHGAMGAALSFLVAVLIQNMGTIGVAWYKDKFPALNVGTALVLVMVSALLLLNVVGQIDGWLSVLGMMVVLLIMAINGWGTISVVWRAARTRFSSNLEDSV